MAALNIADLEKLIAHETRYFEIWSQVTQTPHIWFLDGLVMPDYQSANRALHLRIADVERPAHRPDSIIGTNAASIEYKSVEQEAIEQEAVEQEAHESIEGIVGETIAHFRGRGLPVVVDVDPVAEEQGFGRELRRRGVTPVIGSTLLMRYGTEFPPELKSSAGENTGLRIERIANESGAGEAREWIYLAGSDEENAEEAAFWRTVADAEARSPVCRLYLARIEGQAVGACQLFSHGGWAQIDSVITHPDFRRRGIASSLVAQAVRDSLALGNTTTYLFTDNGGAGEKVYRRLGFEVWGVNVLRRHIQW